MQLCAVTNSFDPKLKLPFFFQGNIELHGCDPRVTYETYGKQWFEIMNLWLKKTNMDECKLLILFGNVGGSLVVNSFRATQ